MSLTQVEAGTLRESQSTPVEWQRKHVLLLFASLATIYIILAVVRILGRPLDGSQHFIYLADGWLHGHLYLHNIPPDTQDYTLHNGHWYVAFPPLPAVLLLPIVAIFHLSHQAIISLIFSLGIGILNIWLMLGVLKRLARRHLPRLTFAAAAWLTVLFALGTEHLFATMQGNVWYTAHVVATTFLLLYTGETLDKRRPVLAGLYLGLATLSRSTTLFTFPFFILLAIGAFFVNQQGFRRPVPWKHLFLFFIVLGTFIAAMLLYNQARFGSPFDFGYNTMKVNPFVRGNLHTYGQFNWHFISTNFRYMLLEPPYIVSHAPYLTFNPWVRASSGRLRHYCWRSWPFAIESATGWQHHFSRPASCQWHCYCSTSTQAGTSLAIALFSIFFPLPCCWQPWAYERSLDGGKKY